MSEPLTESELLRRIAEGDKQRYAEIVDRYKGKIYGLLRGMGAGHQDAQDLAQETFIRAYRRLGDLHERERFSAWLYSIAVNAMRDFARKRIIRPIGEERMPEPSSGETPEQRVLEREMRREVQVMLEALPDKYRLVLLLRYTNELSYEEIANITGLGTGQVRNRIHRAKKMLYKKMQTEGGLRYEMF
ncbi:sigma-70 family RNA polymerase sigma factor [Saccharibacillus sp. CPCC 101409]|uniref:RNA polymerase sigma factor n=1 Tax=Saccharibacillus sp. CPCC 101409 TaxID=3058041 RepID=UPI0026740320|nr:sigma-70 family RNA polymerase sigma factor [Saccharibacillus sp. CPCC 101409]MDO3410324.1 sigma-70 family RNA polymerase sigma factor [Saccharibacillus sp. CPCC 101409]